MIQPDNKQLSVYDLTTGNNNNGKFIYILRGGNK